MELRQLHYFLAVAEERHFGRAAARIPLSQPGLSRQIQKLEEELGVQLFVRTKRHVELTAAGNLFLEQVRLALTQLDRAVQLARQSARGEHSQLVLAFVDSMLYTVIPHVVQVFQQRYPDVDLQVEESDPVSQVQALLSGEIDVGLMYAPIREPTLMVEIILREPLVVVLPAGHRLAHIQPLRLQDVVQEPMLIPARHLNPTLFEQMMHLYTTSGFVPKVVHEVMQKQTIVGLVAGGKGVTLLPASLQRLQRPGVIYVPLGEPTLYIETALVWRRETQSPLIDVLRMVLRDFEDTCPKDGVLMDAISTIVGQLPE